MSTTNGHTISIDELDRLSLVEEPPAPPKKLIHADELDNLPPLSWLVDGEIPRNGLSALVGPSGSGKSFVALDYALRIAQLDAVVYVAAEGASGYAIRKNAWCRHYQEPAGHLHFWLEAVNLLDPSAVDAFIAEVRPLAPAMIVLDTLARCMVGGDENSAKDMGLFIAACDRVRNATGATILLVHHTGKSGEYRGSSSFLGALDTMITLTNDDGLITLSCGKTKDHKEFTARYLRMLPSGESCVLVPAAQVVGSLSKSNRLTDQQRKMLQFLALEIFEESGARSRDIEQKNIMPRASIFNVLSGLKRVGYISQGSKGDPYYITPSGREALQRETEAGSLERALPHPNAQVQQSKGSLTTSPMDFKSNSPTVSHSFRSETETRLETETDSQTNGNKPDGRVPS